MPEYSKDVTHKTRRSALSVAKRMKKAGSHVKVVAVTRYKIVRTR